ncbi:hypothetical protein GTQ40_04520 [Flavobacteriaceae bacterium R38]|nr:hypothetical protein [Flavobacteriaceae bacterium R38]
MTKLFSILISFLILAQSFNISFNDIIQFDELIAHAQFHKEQYGDDFFVFLSKHYGKLKTEHSKKHQEEKEDHEQLPFQHRINVIAFSTFFLNQYNDLTNKTVSFTETNKNFYYQKLYSSLEGFDIFQPPKHL